MRPAKKPAAVLACALSSFLLGSCAQQPMGPTVQAMPGPNKPFQVFAQEQEACKAYASFQVKGHADAANQQAIGATLLGAGLGAGLGAAIGGGQGAGIGAASGGIIGTSVGAYQTNGIQQSIQQQYNNAYVTCMYAKGNQIPGMAPTASESEGDPAPLAAETAPASSLTASLLKGEPSHWKFQGGGYSQEVDIFPLGGGRYKVDLATGGHGCGGEAKGTALDQGHGRLTLSTAEDGTRCELDMRLLGRNRLSVKEVYCSAFHGTACGFDATYNRSR